MAKNIPADPNDPQQNPDGPINASDLPASGQGGGDVQIPGAPSPNSPVPTPSDNYGSNGPQSPTVGVGTPVGPYGYDTGPTPPAPTGPTGPTGPPDPPLQEGGGGGGGELGPPTPDATDPAKTSQGGTGFGAGTDFQSALRNQLMTLMGRDNSNSPAIQADRLAEAHGLQNSQQMLAERAAAEGTNNSGGFDSKDLGLQQDSAGRQATFAGNQQNVNDQTILQALGLGSGLYNEDQNRDLGASEFESNQNDQIMQLLLNSLNQQGQGAM